MTHITLIIYLQKKNKKNVEILFCFVFKKLRGCLIDMFKHMFSVFKQHYTNFHTLFHPCVFSHVSNNKIHVFKHIYQIPPNMLKDDVIKFVKIIALF